MKKAYMRILGLLIFAVILYKIDLVKLFPILKSLNGYLFGIAIILIFPMMLLKVVRWNALLRMQGISYSLKNAVSVYLASYYVGVITPGRAGDFLKTWYLNKDQGVPYGKGLVSVLIDRLLDLFFIVFVSILGIFSFGLFHRFGYISLGFLALLLIAFGLLFNGNVLDRVLKIIYKLLSKKYRDKTQLHFNDFAGDIDKLKSIRLFVPVLLTVLAYAVTFLQCYLIALSLHISLSFYYIAFAISIGGLVALIPISFSGIGTRDATLIFLFGLRGINSQQAVSFSLLYLAVFGLAIGGWGAVCWFRNPVKLKERLSANAERVQQ